MVEDLQRRLRSFVDRRFAAPQPNHRRAPPTNAVASAHDPKGPSPLSTPSTFVVPLSLGPGAFLASKHRLNSPPNP